MLVAPKCITVLETIDFVSCDIVWERKKTTLWAQLEFGCTETNVSVINVVTFSTKMFLLLKYTFLLKLTCFYSLVFYNFRVLQFSFTCTKTAVKFSSESSLKTWMDSAFSKDKREKNQIENLGTDHPTHLSFKFTSLIWWYKYPWDD